MLKNSISVASLFLIIVLFVSSCASNDTASSDTVKQSEIYQSYSITYDASDNELFAKASFRFGGSNGTTLILAKPSNVVFDKQEMAMRNNFFSGTFYKINSKSDFKTKYVFKFTDTDKKTYSNEVSIQAIKLTYYANILDTNDTYKVKWDNPLKSNEEVILTLKDSKGKVKTKSIDVLGANSIEFMSSDLKGLDSGSAHIFLKNKKNSELKEATHLGGNITFEYSSTKAAIKIK